MRHLIIGNGVAGISVAETIRKNRHDDEIILLSDETGPPYWRASLTKYILDIIPADKMLVKPSSWIQNLSVQQVNGKAISIQPDKQTVIYSNESGEQALAFDRLCITTGASPIRLNIPGQDLPEVMTFRTLKEADKIRTLLPALSHIVVIGGGVLGMEVVDIAISRGISCTVLQRGNKLGQPVVDEEGADILLHRVNGEDGIHKKGADVIFGDAIEEFIGGKGHLTGVRLGSGSVIACDLAVMCIGIGSDPNLFSGSELQFDRGLKVDDHQESSIPGIYGAGDCVVYPNESGDVVPTRTWVTSRIQGKTAGFNMCDIPCLLFDEGPMYNASLLFDLLYTIVGEFDASGPPYSSYAQRTSEFSYRKIVFKKDRIVGAMMLGDRNGDQAIRRLIAQKVEIPAETDKKALLDPEFDPNDLAQHGIEYIMY